MTLWKKFATIGAALMLVFLWIPPDLSAQSIQLDIGRMLFKMSDFGNERDGCYMNYPQDEWTSGIHSDWFPSGMIENVVPDEGPPLSDRAFGVRAMPAGDFGKDDLHIKVLYLRRPVPVKLYTREEKEQSNPTLGTVDPNLETDQKIVLDMQVNSTYSRWQTEAWGFADATLDQSVIVHSKMIFDGVRTYQGGENDDSTIYIPPGQVLTLWSGLNGLGGNARAYDRWHSGDNADDYHIVRSRPSQLLTVADASRAAQLDMVYLRDAATDLTLDWNGQPLEDTGDPYVGPNFAKTRDAETGEFISDKYFGRSWLHFDKSGADETDRFNPADLVQHAPATIFHVRRSYEWFTSWVQYGGLDAARLMLRTPGYEITDYQAHFDAQGVTTASVASAPQQSELERLGNQYVLYMLAGPYQQAHMEDHDIVHVFAVAEPPRRESMNLGGRYLTWLAQSDPANHPKGVGTGLTPLSNLEKHAYLWTIEDSLFYQIDKAFYAFHGGRNSGLSLAQKKQGAGLARMPDPPPTPNILVKEGPGVVDVIAWYEDDEAFEDFDTGNDDFMGWRVYRKQGRADVMNPQELENFGYYDWELVASVTATGAVGPTGQTIAGVPGLAADHYNQDYTFKEGTQHRVFRFADATAIVNESYFYAVTAFDNGSSNTTGITAGRSLESSMTDGMMRVEPVRAFTAGKPTSDSVRVVPNPWALDLGAGLFPGNDRNVINFVNLPPIATLKIFNETGDELYTIVHTSGTAQEVWNQQTTSTQLVVSGVYILAVVDAKDVDPVSGEETPLPDSFVKFVIIR